MSVALPLPSSPHCAPTITMAGMAQVLPVTERKPQAAALRSGRQARQGLLHSDVTGTGLQAPGTSAWPARSRLQRRDRRGAALGQELLAPGRLVVLPHGRGPAASHVQSTHA